ncbi:Helix loop helix transcription factor EB [Ceraceosorus bombacis]|uniref:Helix loop helix transcription factor EB n=1 Tax=Ceraceosorus bombacis TaxID=401625 RepID=A0A0P1BCH8_9BASI|nr:Helix loop helix transcription factor EB [Ceraceosorus bombacis]
MSTHHNGQLVQDAEQSSQPQEPAPAPLPEGEAGETVTGLDASQTNRDGDQENEDDQDLTTAFLAYAAQQRGADGDSSQPPADNEASAEGGSLDHDQAADALTSFASGERRSTEPHHENGQRDGKDDQDDYRPVYGQGQSGNAFASQDAPAGEGQNADSSEIRRDTLGPEDEAIAAMGALAGGDPPSANGEQAGEGGTENKGDKPWKAIPEGMSEEDARAAGYFDESVDDIKGGKKGKSRKEMSERELKDKHKEVERRRREVLSQNIETLASLVPGIDPKQPKSTLLQKVNEYIIKLKKEDHSNLEKWTLEKLLMDQAMSDLQAQFDDLKRENGRFREQLGLPPAEDNPPASAQLESAKQDSERLRDQYNLQGDESQPPAPAPAAEGNDQGQGDIYYPEDRSQEYSGDIKQQHQFNEHDAGDPTAAEAGVPAPSHDDAEALRQFAEGAVAGAAAASARDVAAQKGGDVEMAVDEASGGAKRALEAEAPVESARSKRARG